MTPFAGSLNGLAHPEYCQVMTYSRRICLTLILLLYIQQVYPLECVSFHDFYEQGKSRKINLGFCGASTGYCVKAVYADPNYVSKNGFSLGCDKTDCTHVGDPDYGWDEHNCRSNTDFGRDGYICCCNDKDHCNSAPTFNLMLSSIIYIFVAITFYF